MTPHHLQNIKARPFNVVSKAFLDVPSQTIWACLLLFPACDLRFRSAPTSSAFSHLPISAAPSAFNDLDSLPFTLKSITTSLFSHWPGSVATRVCLLSPCACLYCHVTHCVDELVYPVNSVGTSLVHFVFLVPSMLPVTQ